MLKELKFVQGAVGKKEFIPAVTHFCFENGTVRSYNGTMALCTPIDCALECKPLAVPMVAAISKCTETIALSITPTGKLSIKSGSFKALVPCNNDDVQVHVLPEGDFIEFDGQALLDGLKAVQPFIGTDASRQWGMGVLIKGKSLFATNNVCLIEYWVGADFPRVVNLPRAAVAELLRIGECPIGAQCTDTSMTFHYSSGKWLRTSLYSTQWPDLESVLNRPGNLRPIDPMFWNGLDSLKMFTDRNGSVLISDGMMRTHEDIGEGACFELDWCQAPETAEEFKHPSLWNVSMLGLLQGVATQLDLSSYPSPCLFQGERIRGAIIGMRL